MTEAVETPVAYRPWIGEPSALNTRPFTSVTAPP